MSHWYDECVSDITALIAAGQTAFNAHFSHQSTEQVYEDWESGEQQHEEESYDNAGQDEQEEHEGIERRAST